MLSWNEHCNPAERGSSCPEERAVTKPTLGGPLEMISLRKTCFAVASAFALTMAVEAAPAAAQVDSHGHEMCNPITNITPQNPIHSLNGNLVLQQSSYPCPVAEAPAPAPAPAPAAPQTYTVYFDFDRSNIRADAEPVLRQALEAAQAGNQNFVLTGHTDTVG